MPLYSITVIHFKDNYVTLHQLTYISLSCDQLCTIRKVLQMVRSLAYVASEIEPLIQVLRAFDASAKRYLDGTQYPSYWPILVISARSSSLICSVFDSRGSFRTPSPKLTTKGFCKDVHQILDERTHFFFRHRRKNRWRLQLDRHARISLLSHLKPST